MILVNVRNNEVWYLTLIEVHNFVILIIQRYQKIQNFFGMSVSPTFKTSMLMVTLR